MTSKCSLYINGRFLHLQIHCTSWVSWTGCARADNVIFHNFFTRPAEYLCPWYPLIPFHFPFFKRSICAVCTFPWPSSALSVLSIFLDYQIKRHSDLFSTVCVALFIRNSHERNTLSKRFWSELFPIAKDPSGLRTVGFYFFYKCNVVSIFLWTSLILNLGVEHSFGQG